MLQHNKLQRSHRGYSRPRRSWQQSRRLQSESTLCYWTFDYYPFLQTTKSENVMKKSPNASRRYAKSGNVSNPERDPSNKGWFFACLVFGHVLWKVRGKPGQQILRCTVHKPWQSPTILHSCGCLTYWTLHCLDLLKASGSHFRCAKDRHCFALKLLTKTRHQVQTWCILHLVSWQALLGGKQANKGSQE